MEVIMDNGTGGFVMGIGKGDVTVDLQRIGEIYRNVCCTNQGCVQLAVAH